MTGVDVRQRAETSYRQIAELVRGPTALMEVCGTHTMAISRFGIRARMPKALRLLSGPGCPVCVTPAAQIDHLLAIAGEPGVVVTTFGDMMRVPGSRSSLERVRAQGRDIRVVCSAFEALRLAEQHTDKTIVFMGVGFETTSPTVAATLARARERATKNFVVYPAFKTVVPAMAALLSLRETRIDGFICPGHVSTVIGSKPYEVLAQDYRVPCVVTGFDATDVLDGIVMLLEQNVAGRAEVQVQYRRAVRAEGNRTAQDLMRRVFVECDAMWRGIGMIPRSGLEMSEAYADFDARRRIEVEPTEPAEDLPRGCSCGEVMRGVKLPVECALFGRACTPASPVGPCMVSTEGACAAYHRVSGEV